MAAVNGSDGECMTVIVSVTLVIVSGKAARREKKAPPSHTDASFV